MSTSWDDALLAASLLAIDPEGLGGAMLRAGAGPVRDAWLAALRARLPSGKPMRRMPAGIGDERMLGGLDLAATLRAGRPVTQPGLLAETDRGIVVVPMAERLPAATAARIGAVLDAGAVGVERDGLREALPARLGVVLLDEGRDDDPPPPSGLADRLALSLDLHAIGWREAADEVPDPALAATARTRLAAVICPDALAAGLCAAALALGVWSMRASLLALRVACAAAALAGRTEVTDADAEVAARLVLAPRATRLPAPPEAEAPPDEPPVPDDAPKDGPPHDDDADADAADTDDPPDGVPPDDLLLAAAAAAIPPGLLARLLAAGPVRGQARTESRAGAVRRGRARGRPAGSRPGDPRTGLRLDLIATLRAAAPWQVLRRREDGQPDRIHLRRIRLRRDDFRVVRRRQRGGTTAIFIVDASGSAALNRLAEAKGAVELLLADCYARRDQVALIAFRKRGADLLLPPTRSLARARRSLAGLPGGGGTPLSAALDAAAALADLERRRGQTPLLVLLTDGRANVARDGEGGRRRAEADALDAAGRLRVAAVAGLLLDTAPRPHPFAREIAERMGARYLPLPQAGAAAISGAVQAVRG